MTDKKVCPILPFSTDHVLGHDVHEPRPCLGDRCAWWAVDRCFLAGIGLASHALGDMVVRLLEGELLIKRVTEQDKPRIEQDDQGVFHV